MAFILSGAFAWYSIYSGEAKSFSWVVGIFAVGISIFLITGAWMIFDTKKQSIEYYKSKIEFIDQQFR